MSDVDLSRLDAAFADMRSQTAPFVSSPGFAAAKAAARHRSRVRAAALTGLAAALIVLPVAAYATWYQDRGTPPVLAPTPTPTATTSAPSPTPSPSAQPTEQPVTPAGTATGKGSPTRGRLIDEPLGYTPIWVEGAISGLTTYIPVNDSNTVSIGVKVMANKGVTNAGPAHNVKLTVDLSAVTGSIDITAVSGPCTISGSTVRCTFGTLPIGEHRVQLTLRARPEATPGRVGQATLEVTGNELSWHTKEAYGWVEIRA